MGMSNCIYESTAGCLGNGRAKKGDKHIGTNHEGCFKPFIVNSSIGLALVSLIKFLV